MTAGLAEQNAQLEWLIVFSRQLSISLDLPTICTTLRQFISAHMDCDSLAVSRYTPEDNLIRALYAFNDGNELDVSEFPALVMPDNPGQGSQSLAICEKRSIYIPDFDVILKNNSQAYLADEKHGIVAADEFLEAAVEDDEDEYTRSALIVPLILQNAAVGALQVMSYQTDAYQPEHLQLLEAAAAHVAIAINNAMLYQQAQIELGERRRADYRFKMLFDVVPDVLLVVNMAGEILHVNHAFITVLGYAQDAQEQPRSSARLLPPEEYEWVMANLHEINLEAGIQKAVLVRKAAGSYLEVDLALTPIMWGDQPAALVILHDISAQQLLAEERLQSELLRVAVQKERDILEVRERFIAMLSHEFRNPLAVIVTLVETLLHYSDRLPFEEQHGKLHRIQQQADRMVAMIDDVLDMRRIQAGRFEFAPKWLNLDLLSAGLIEQQRDIEHFDASNHSIQRTYNGDAWVYADEKLLLHILTNLLSNAVKYSPDGGVVTLDITAIPDSALQIAVHDQGIGIPAALQNQLFEPFFRASNVKHIPGTGLGLVIVRESIRAHGGSIAFSSTEGHGTTFTVSLPNMQPSPIKA